MEMTPVLDGRAGIFSTRRVTPEYSNSIKMVLMKVRREARDAEGTTGTILFPELL
jgi:hypothetical protein